MLKIDRSEPDDLNISEDPVVYSPLEIKNLLQRIAEGNRATGGLTFVAKVFGIAGQCVKPHVYAYFGYFGATDFLTQVVVFYIYMELWEFVGCIKFMESYYLILVTKRRQIGSICGHAIYSIDESQLITIPHVSIQTDIAHSKTELR